MVWNNFTAFELINQLLYINFPSLKRKIFLKDLKSTLSSSAASVYDYDSHRLRYCSTKMLGQKAGHECFDDPFRVDYTKQWQYGYLTL